MPQTSENVPVPVMLRLIGDDQLLADKSRVRVDPEDARDYLYRSADAIEKLIALNREIIHSWTDKSATAALMGQLVKALQRLD